MSSSRIRYTDKFKRDAVARVQAGEAPSAVARSVKISEGLLRRWASARPAEAPPKKRVRKSRVQATAPLVDEGGPLVEVNPDSRPATTPVDALQLAVGRLERAQADLKVLEQANEHLRERLRQAERGSQKDYTENRLLRALTVLLLGYDKNLDSQLAP